MKREKEKVNARNSKSRDCTELREETQRDKPIYSTIL